MSKTLDQLRSEKKTGRPVPVKKQPETFGEILLSWVKTIVGAIVIVMIINGLLIASFVVPTGSMENTVMTGDFLFVNKFIYGPSTPQIIPFINVPLPFYRFPGIRDPKKGDVIVFIFPGNRDEVESSEFQYYLKRCVATKGDKLEVRNKKLFVNDQEVPLAPHGKLDYNMPIYPGEEDRTFPPGKGFTRDNWGPVVIPKKGDVIPLSSANYMQWETFIRREGHKVDLNGSTIMVDSKPVTQYVVQRDYCFGMGDNRDNSLDSRYWGFVPVESVVGTPLMVYWSWDTNLPGFFSKFSTIRWNRFGTIIR